MEDSGAKSDLMNSGVLTQQIIEEKNFSMLPRDHFCDILVKKVATFYPCLESLPEAKMKNYVLITVAEEISKQPSIDSVA